MTSIEGESVTVTETAIMRVRRTEIEIELATRSGRGNERIATGIVGKEAGREKRNDIATTGDRADGGRTQAGRETR